MVCLSSCTKQSSEKPRDLAEGSQVFVITPDGIDHLATNAPALTVTLQILITTNPSGQIERVGRTTFFWSDVSDTRGGSTLSGTATVRLRRPNNSVVVQTENAPIASNRTLYASSSYTSHRANTPSTSQTGGLCIDVTDWNLVTSKGLSFTFTKPLVYCLGNTTSGADMVAKLEPGSASSIPVSLTDAVVIAIQNFGPRIASNPLLQLQLPPHLTFVSDNSKEFNCLSLASGLVECRLASGTSLGPKSVGVSINLKATQIATGIVTTMITSDTADPDSVNNLLEFSIETTADTTLPTLTLKSNDVWITEDDTIVLTATATDDAGISHVEFYDGDTFLADYLASSSLTFTARHHINVNQANNGSHSYTAKAYDIHTNTTTSSSIDVNVTIGDNSICSVLPSSPNVILIISDDHMFQDYVHMQYLQEELIEEGMSFTNAFTGVSTCCPARASILTGQYAHNHGVLHTNGPAGSFSAFYLSGHENTTLATWLNNGGYHTGLMGKYLNYYPGVSQNNRVVSETHIPLGWDEWYALLYKQQFYDYTLNKNGFVRTYGHDESDYQVDQLKNLAKGFIQRNACGNTPFFLYFSPTVPHTPLIPAMRHESLFSGVQLPQLPSFNEADVSDKPSIIRNLPMLSSNQISVLNETYQKRLQMLQSLDEAIHSIISTLEAKGVLENTYILFTSDNGYHMGEHRFMPNKGYAYEEDIHIPMIIRGPTVPHGHVNSELVLNSDIAPTIMSWADISIPPIIDGQSLDPVLNDATSSLKTSMLFQIWNKYGVLRYSAIRTKKYKYIEWYTNLEGQPLSTPEYELYNLGMDPYELSNIYVESANGLKVELETELNRLKNCQGHDCSDSIDTVPPIISSSVTGVIGNDGWYISDVSLYWTVDDTLSEVTSTVGCDEIMITNDTPALFSSCQAASDGGISSADFTIKRDTLDPEIAITGVSEGLIYTLGSVPVAGCSTSDSTSGVAIDAIINISGGDPDGTGTFIATCSGAIDNAGNVASDVSVTYRVNP